MSPEAAVRCREWLEEQLEALRGLRNGNARDAQFKIWRQATLTVIQRIWPGDHSRSDRFRRIRFSAPQSKVDPRSAADWFARGCDDATLYLELWIAEIDKDGVPQPSEREHDEPGDTVGLAEEAFPTLELGASGSPGSRGIEIPAEREIILDLGGSAAPAAPEGVTRDASGPEPPKLPSSASRSMTRPASMKATRPPARAVEPAPKSEPVAKSEPESRRDVSETRAAAPRPAEPTRTKSPKRGGPKSRLKDLLGLDDVVARVRDERVAPEDVEISEPPPTAEPRAIAEAPAPPLAAPVPTNDADRPAPVEVASAEGITRPVAPEAAAPPADGDDMPSSEAIEAATQRFLETSPVLSLTGRPVQRRTDVTRFEQPDAVALATLAEDVGRLGVPETRRDAVRAQLVDLAQQLETGSADWELLSDVVREAVAYRPLAQRLMPVLLPWLTRAA